MTDQLTLAVDGKSYEGWIDVNIERSLDQFANSFSLNYIDRWSEQDEPWRIREGAGAQLKFGSQTLITGFICTAEWNATANEYHLTASGRSKTADLADCTAIHKTGHWSKQTAEAIIKDLIAPYGLTITVQGSTDKIDRFSLEEGETVFDAIDRLCKVQGFLPVTSREGNLILLRTDKPIGEVIQFPVETSIQRYFRSDDQERFSDYIFRGQKSGVDADGDATTIGVTGLISDDAVTRSRPLVVVADAPASIAKMKQRAEWEKNVRAGRAMRARYTVPGVMSPAKRPWAPGLWCHVSDPVWGIDDNLVIVRAIVRGSSTELVSEIEFTRPEAFSLLTFPKKLLNKVTKSGKALHKTTAIADQQKP